MKNIMLIVIMSVLSTSVFARDSRDDIRYRSGYYDQYSRYGVYTEPWTGSVVLRGPNFQYTYGRLPSRYSGYQPYQYSGPEYITSIEYEPRCNWYVQRKRQIGWR
jgi:hypothetical protein